MLQKKDPFPKVNKFYAVWYFENLKLDIVSSFGFMISNLRTPVFAKI